jgi:hypothetical protein
MLGKHQRDLLRIGAFHDRSIRVADATDRIFETPTKTDRETIRRSLASLATSGFVTLSEGSFQITDKGRERVLEDSVLPKLLDAIEKLPDRIAAKLSTTTPAAKSSPKKYAYPDDFEDWDEKKRKGWLDDLILPLFDDGLERSMTNICKTLNLDKKHVEYHLNETGLRCIKKKEIKRQGMRPYWAYYNPNPPPTPEDEGKEF